MEILYVVIGKFEKVMKIDCLDSKGTLCEGCMP